MLQSIQETQASILKLLKARGTLSTNRLAQALDFHAMSIRQHLMTLEREGYVAHYRVKGPRQGRPTKMYELTDKGHSLFPTGYVSFVLRLLKSIEHLDGKEKLGKHFQNIMGSILSDGKKLEGLSLNEKVQVLSQRLNKAEYMAEWEENTEGFVIKMYNCPIGKIASEYPQICDQEQNHMEKLLGVQVKRCCHKIKGDCLCSYQIARPL